MLSMTNNNNNTSTILSAPPTIMEASTMTTGEDGSERTPHTDRNTAAVAAASPQPENDDVSVISTTCSSVDGEGEQQSPVKPAAPKKTLWKDKNGAARYVKGNAPAKKVEEANNRDARELVATAAVTAAVTVGAVGGLVVLGPFGLAVGGLASAGSAASAFATRKRLNFLQRRQKQQERASELRVSTTAPEELIPERFFNNDYGQGQAGRDRIEDLVEEAERLEDLVDEQDMIKRTETKDTADSSDAGEEMEDAGEEMEESIHDILGTTPRGESVLDIVGEDSCEC